LDFGLLLVVCPHTPVSSDPTMRPYQANLWLLTAFAIACLAAANPFYRPEIPLPVGVALLVADMLLVLLLGLRPFTARLGLPVALLLLPVPIFVSASSVSRFALMVLMALAVAIAGAAGFAPPRFRTPVAALFCWFGTKTIARRPRKFDAPALLRLVAAAVILAFALAVLRTAAPAGAGWLLRWFSGGVAVFSFGEMVLASQDVITSVLGLDAPALGRSPWLSTSVGEFWTRRWNAAVSELGFRYLFFRPLARHGRVPALFAAFLASAVVHYLLCFMATGRVQISLAFGAFFLVQPVFILAERAMGIRRWPVRWARTWTLAALALTSPLFVEPVARMIMPFLDATPTTLPATMVMLGVAIGLNLFLALGQLAFCRPTTDEHG
jgi:Membrane bound O-acyl transferase family